MAEDTCSIDGCEQTLAARGWCTKHYKRWKKVGDPGPAGKLAKPEPQICEIEKCGRPRWARGWCAMHYTRWRAHGDPNTVTRRRLPTDIGPICAVDDCGRPRKKGSDLCPGHTERLRLKGVRGGALNVRNPRPEHCSADDCDNPVQARGLCGTHYMRWLNGSPKTGPIDRPGRPSLPRETWKCRGCRKPVERLNPRLYVLCSECAAKPRKPHRNYYGKTWQAARKAVRERDRSLCRSCGRPESERQHAVAHIVPFDIALAEGWPEEKIHHPANLLLLCQPCHIAFDRRPGWAYDAQERSRPESPAWANEYRLSDLIAFIAEYHEAEIRAELRARRRELRTGQLRLIEGGP